MKIKTADMVVQNSSLGPASRLLAILLCSEGAPTCNKETTHLPSHKEWSSHLSAEGSLSVDAQSIPGFDPLLSPMAF